MMIERANIGEISDEVAPSLSIHIDIRVLTIGNVTDSSP
ncbi:hypothetical protein VIBNISFn118_1160032 [Vibrio nigripulchritudo SFn118]|nr:hypothetical protein VIBNISFn118_1160032 [Vibrio nigripulchritudo SFn118]